MASFSGELKIGNNTIDLSASQLGKLAKQAFSLLAGGKLANVLEKPVSSLPSPGIEFKESLAFSQGAAWSLPETALTLSVDENATADVAILNGGTLFQYTDGLSDPQPVSVTVPAGVAYVKIEFKVATDGNLAAAANLATSVGITGSAQAGVSFTLAYYKAIAPSATVQEAVTEAVQSFVLPFHSGTLKGLDKGDYLYHNFAGNLALGFGVNYGVSGSLLSGRSVQEVKASFTSPLVSSSLSLAPTFTAGAKLDLTYKHMDFFEMLLHRSPAGAADKVDLHLFRADKSNLGLTFDAAINVDHDAKFDVSTNLGTLVDQIGEHVTSRLQDAIEKPKVTDTVRNLFGKAKDAIDNFIGDANQRVNGLLQKANNRGIDLKGAIEEQKSRVSLFNYIFDLENKNNNVEQAWQAAIKGDFAAAYQTPGHPMEISPGSGIEKEFVRRSSVSLNLFGLFQTTSVTQFFENSSVAYAGNGTFNLLFKTGIEWDTTGKSKESIAAITFSAAATSQGMSNVQQLQVEMNVQLTDVAKPGAAGFSAGVLKDSGAGALQPVADQAGSFIQGNPKGTFAIQASLEPSAYGRLTASQFSGKKPPPLPQADDAKNYAAFVQACRDLFSGDAYEGFPDLAREYAQWQEYNKFTNGAQQPNRRGFGNRSMAPPFWPGGLTSNQRMLIIAYIEAAQRFMNLCDDLSHLAADLPAVQTPEQFTQVLETLKFMVKNDADIWFTKPMLLALLRLTMTNGAIIGLQTGLGATTGAPGAGRFTVSFQVQ